jgi:hypothetical protein
MCETLKIKIAIIRRTCKDCGTVNDLTIFEKISYERLVNYFLGTTEISFNMIAYVLVRTNEEIIRNIRDNVPVAIELDNLKANWN